MNDYPIFGIRNLGNTCYINSVIQCLRHTPDLYLYLHSEKFKKDLMRYYKQNENIEEAILVESFSNIVKKTVNLPPKTVIRPEDFIRKFDEKFHEIALIPQDSHEALNFLLDQFHNMTSHKVKIDLLNMTKEGAKSWKKFYEKDFSEIISLFYGQLETVITCNQCKHKTITYAPFNDFNIELTQNLLKSIKLLFSEEDVEKRCEKCNTEENIEMTKKQMISMFPQYLIIQVKRFQFGMQGLRKIDGPLEVSDMIDISKYHAYKNRYGIYQLYAGIIHLGSPTFGHYISFCKTNDFWYKYDDDSVNQLSPKELEYLKNNAYVLFYKKL